MGKSILLIFGEVLGRFLDP
uniref:Uncharacterized protein n=1 Tax=Anguilla anguilla TaxID=7936 RepID=A0A0E9S6C6_ANGAN